MNILRFVLKVPKYEKQILTLLLVHPTPNLSRINLHLVKQSQGLPPEAFHVATKQVLNPDRKLTGATIGYNVAVANNKLRYNLRLP